METKANPNPDGCLAKALPDEPFFVLLARDLTAPGTIRFWADQRAQASVDDEHYQDAGQLTEAFETADAMEAWREANDGLWRAISPAPIWFLIWSEEHRAWWRPARHGYTDHMMEAGLYSEREARQIAREANWGGQFNETAMEAPIWLAERRRALSHD